MLVSMTKDHLARPIQALYTSCMDGPWYLTLLTVDVQIKFKVWFTFVLGGNVLDLRLGYSSH